jgi:hypothetical protein
VRPRATRACRRARARLRPACPPARPPAWLPQQLGVLIGLRGRGGPVDAGRPWSAGAQPAGSCGETGAKLAASLAARSLEEVFLSVAKKAELEAAVASGKTTTDVRSQQLRLPGTRLRHRCRAACCKVRCPRVWVC